MIYYPEDIVEFERRLYTVRDHAGDNVEFTNRFVVHVSEIKLISRAKDIAAIKKKVPAKKWNNCGRFRDSNIK